VPIVALDGVMRRLLSLATAIVGLLAGLDAFSAASAEGRIALLIGNQAYNAKVGPLRNPHRDIALIGEALQRLGFRVTLIRDADYKSMDIGIKRHMQNVRREGPGTLSFVYYSGHGAADPDTKINYLIPIDVANAQDDDLWTNSLNLNSVVEALRNQAPTATHYVVFDACRNELNLTRRGQKALLDKGFVPLAYTPGVMVAYATAPGQTAADGGDDGGAYAQALAREIVEPGVEAVTMFRRTALRVNREIGQDPWLSASTLPEVYFAGPPANSGAGQDSRAAEAERVWLTIKDASDHVVFENFIKRYPDTLYATLAQGRLERLRKAALLPPTQASLSPPAASPPVAGAGSCPGNPHALGVARTVDVDTSGGPGFGLAQFKDSDFLITGEVVLTFDDGPWPGNTHAVLEALAEHCVKATFFPIGKHALWHPEILKEVAAAGHTIGGHTWSHANLGVVRGGQAIEEIEKGFSAVQVALGAPPSPFFRFPFLKDQKEQLGYLGARNIAIFSSDLDSFDFKLRKPEDVVTSVITKLERSGKGIILLHDFQQATAKAAPELLNQLKAKGYRVVHIRAKAPLATLPKWDEIAAGELTGHVASRPTPRVVRTLPTKSERPPAGAPASR
jgi:peptidoglycan/xylan/chitin deacetylase (PgdA/CDA1 family)